MITFTSGGLSECGPSRDEAKEKFIKEQRKDAVDASVSGLKRGNVASSSCCGGQLCLVSKRSLTS